MRILEVGIGTLTNLAFSPDGRTLAVAGYEGIAIAPWPEVAEGKAEFLLEPTEERIAQIAWHPDGRMFATGGMDHGIVLIRNARLRVLRDLVRVSDHNGPVEAIAFSPDGGTLVFAGGWWDEPSEYVEVDTHSWRTIAQREAHANQIGALAFVRPELLATGSADRTVALHKRKLLLVESYERKVASPVQAIAVRSDGDVIATAAGNLIHLWGIDEAGRFRDDERTSKGHKGEVRAIGFSPDSRLLVSAGNDGTLRFWHGQHGSPRTQLDPKLGALRAVSFLRDGLTVVAGGSAGNLAVVDVDC